MRILIGTIAISVLSISMAQAKPSFNCTKAYSHVEKTICSHNILATSDVLIAKAKRALDPVTKKALQQDQQYFVVVRDEGFEKPWDERTSVEWLKIQLEDRLVFLHSVKKNPTKGMVGYWGNLFGGLDIAMIANGAYKVRLNAVDPRSARWVCDLDAEGKLVDGVLIAEDPEIEGWQVTVHRVGAGLIVKETAKPNTKTDGYSPYCGMNGTVEGTYFPLTRSKMTGK